MKIPRFDEPNMADRGASATAFEALDKPSGSFGRGGGTRFSRAGWPPMACGGCLAGSWPSRAARAPRPFRFWPSGFCFGIDCPACPWPSLEASAASWERLLAPRDPLRSAGPGIRGWRRGGAGLSADPASRAPSHDLSRRRPASPARTALNSLAA